jgi:hypothetical protein
MIKAWHEATNPKKKRRSSRKRGRYPFAAEMGSETDRNGFEPTINYYPRTLPYDWLNPATRDRLLKPDNDAIFCYPEDLVNLGAYYVLQRYPLTGAVLFGAGGAR